MPPKRRRVICSDSTIPDSDASDSNNELLDSGLGTELLLGEPGSENDELFDHESEMETPSNVHGQTLTSLHERPLPLANAEPGSKIVLQGLLSSMTPGQTTTGNLVTPKSFRTVTLHALSEQTYETIAAGKLHKYTGDWNEIIDRVLPQGLKKDLKSLTTRLTTESSSRGSSIELIDSLQSLLDQGDKVSGLRERKVILPSTISKFATSRVRVIESWPSQGREFPVEFADRPRFEAGSVRGPKTVEGIRTTRPLNNIGFIKDHQHWSKSMNLIATTLNAFDEDIFAADTCPFTYRLADGPKQRFFEKHTGLLSVKEELDDYFCTLIDGPSDGSPACVVINGLMNQALYDEIYRSTDDEYLTLSEGVSIIVRRVLGQAHLLVLHLPHAMRFTMYSGRLLRECFVMDFAIRLCQTIFRVDHSRSSYADYMAEKVGGIIRDGTIHLPADKPRLPTDLIAHFPYLEANRSKAKGKAVPAKSADHDATLEPAAPAKSADHDAPLEQAAPVKSADPDATLDHHLQRIPLMTHAQRMERRRQIKFRYSIEDVDRPLEDLERMVYDQKMAKPLAPPTDPGSVTYSVTTGDMVGNTYNMARMMRKLTGGSMADQDLAVELAAIKDLTCSHCNKDFSSNNRAKETLKSHLNYWCRKMDGLDPSPYRKKKTSKAD